MPMVISILSDSWNKQTNEPPRNNMSPNSYGCMMMYEDLWEFIWDLWGFHGGYPSVNLNIDMDFPAKTMGFQHLA